jgi:Tetratrico peptide repeat
MTNANAVWEKRNTELWMGIDDNAVDEFIAQVDDRVAKLPPRSAIGCLIAVLPGTPLGIRRGGCAVAAAPDVVLTEQRRRRATIRLAHSLRNLGHAADAAVLLTREWNVTSDEPDGAVRAFLAVMLVDLGRAREAVAESLAALAYYLPRYNRSLLHYAQQLTTVVTPP